MCRCRIYFHINPNTDNVVNCGSMLKVSSQLKARLIPSNKSVFWLRLVNAQQVDNEVRLFTSSYQSETSSLNHTEL